MRVVIIGGGTAGTEVARQLRFRDKNVEIFLIDKKGHDQYSPCSMPYYLEGKIKDLKVYSNYEEDNIKYYKGCEVIKISDEKVILKKEEISYDKLVIATGSEAIKPRIKGLEDYYVLKDLDDVKKLKNIKGKTLIIGGGYIGVELAVALEEVTLVEAEPFLFPKTLDKDMSKVVKEYLESKGVKVFTNKKVEEVKDNKFMNERYDNIIVSVGFKASYFVKGEADDYLRLKKNVYVVGDVVKSKNLVTNKKEYCMLANNAVKQASVVADNLLGGKKKYKGFVANAVSKTGDLIVGNVGVTSKKAESVFGKIVVGKFKGLTKYKSCDGKELIVKLVCKQDGVIIGCQIIGYEDVAGRLNMISSYIKNKQKVQDLIEVDTCYNPCVASMHDPVVEAGKVAMKKMMLR